MRIRLLIWFCLGLLLLMLGRWEQHRLFRSALPAMAQTTIPSDSAVSAVYQIDIDGTNLTTLASDLTLGDRSYWSPDGRYLATVVQQDELQQLYIVSADGTQSQQVLSDFSGTYRGPAWSPDGQKFATVIRQDDSSDLYVLDLPSGEVINLTQDAEINDLTVPAWSPDGQRIVYSCGKNGMELCTIESDGQARQSIASSRFPNSLQWSPDGQKIAFSSSLGNDSYVSVVNADGSDSIGLSALSVSAQDFNAVWAPDSQRLALDALEGLVLINADGTDRRVISPDGGQPLWLPDGNQLVFLRSNEIWRVNEDGTALTQITDCFAEQEIESFIGLMEGQKLVLLVSQTS